MSLVLNQGRRRRARLHTVARRPHHDPMSRPLHATVGPLVWLLFPPARVNGSHGAEVLSISESYLHAVNRPENVLAPKNSFVRTQVSG